MKISANPHRLIQNLVFASVCLSLCLVLPFLTGQIPQVGNMLCPMHIPVLLAGFLCGPWWAMAVGFVAPGLRYLIFSMPPLMPIGLCMSFELLSYGLISGLLYRILPVLCLIHFKLCCQLAMWMKSLECGLIPKLAAISPVVL